jgi:hypothetical protein
MEEEIKDTSGFYKNEDGLLVHGPNYVVGLYQNSELRREKKDQYTYPVQGWYWFDSEKEAKIFFNLD